MTLDMLEILVDALLKASEITSEAEHLIWILFIVSALCIGAAWAFSLVVKSYLFSKTL